MHFLTEAFVLFRNIFTLALVGILGLWSNMSLAQSLTLDAAIRRTLDSHPLLKAEGSATQAVERQASLDGLAPAPFISTELENFAGTGTLSGVSSAEASVRLGRVFELGGKREARQQVGASAVARQRNTVEQRRLDITADTTRRFIDVLAKQHQLEMAEKDLKLVAEVKKTMAYRVQRGNNSSADLELAQLAMSRAELVREDAEHELASARVSLSTLWGERSPTFERVQGDLASLPEVASFEALLLQLKQNPDFQTFALEAEQLEAQRRLASANAKPDVTASVGVRRIEALNDQGLIMSFSLPLGSRERSGLALQKNAAEQDRLAARQNAAELDAYQLLFSRYQELRHARHEVESLRDRMIPSAKKALAITQTGYDEGRYSFLQIADARRVLFDLQSQHISAAARYHRLLAEIERTTANTKEISP